MAVPDSFQAHAERGPGASTLHTLSPTDLLQVVTIASLTSPRGDCATQRSCIE